MTANPIVLVDTNILLDVFQKREPFYDSSARLLAAIETGHVQGFVTAHSITTIFYLFQKGRSAEEARAVITNLLQIMSIAPIHQNTIEQALNLSFKDFEDAVQMICAVQCKADCLITRNIKDFQHPLLPIMQPIDFLATL
ncbi:MAG: PIN domain-containing protein [Anaerolineaceae bacterium]|nr:PIN domain-containing protein [Anaerolineaceae bacterium]